MSGLLQEDAAELGVRPGNALVDQGRNSDLSDIQEEEEAAVASHQLLKHQHRGLRLSVHPGGHREETVVQKCQTLGTNKK